MKRTGRTFTTAAIALTGIIAVTADAHAQFGSWNPVQDIGRAVDQVIPGASDAVRVITAPAELPQTIIRSVTPGVHINPMDPLRPTITTPERAWDNLARLPQTIENSLNPFGTALAEAIRRGEARAWPSSQPVPLFVRRALRGRISDAALDRARFSTDWGAAQNGTLQQFLLANYAVAVTLNSVIVFDSPDTALSQDEETVELWAHELTHIEQYARYDIEGFAKRYADDFGNRLESEARSNASRLTASLRTDQLSGGRESQAGQVAPQGRRTQLVSRTQPTRQEVFTYCETPFGNSNTILGGLPVGSPCYIQDAWGRPLFGQVRGAR